MTTESFQNCVRFHNLLLHPFRLATRYCTEILQYELRRLRLMIKGNVKILKTLNLSPNLSSTALSTDDARLILRCVLEVPVGRFRCCEDMGWNLSHFLA